MKFSQSTNEVLYELKGGMWSGTVQKESRRASLTDKEIWIREIWGGLGSTGGGRSAVPGMSHRTNIEELEKHGRCIKNSN